MPSASYIRKRKEIAKRKSKLGVEARRMKMLERARKMKVTGTIKTSGIFGEHTIEFLDFGDEQLGYVRFDGKLRCQKTPEGFLKILGNWIWNKHDAQTKQLRKY